MSEYWHLVDCANCGQQTMIGTPEDTCLLCGKNASKKEVIIMEEMDRVKWEGMKRLERSKWIKEHLDEIVADIRSMSKEKVLEKWPFRLSTYWKLRKIHAPELIGKARGRHAKPQVKPVKPVKKTVYKESRPESGEFSILITEEDLAKLDDEQFRQIWLVFGRIIQNRKSCTKTRRELHT